MIESMQELIFFADVTEVTNNSYAHLIFYKFEETQWSSSETFLLRETLPDTY